MINASNYYIGSKRTEVWVDDGKVFLRQGSASDKYGDWVPIKRQDRLPMYSPELDKKRQDYFSSHRMHEKEKQLEKKGLRWS